MVTRRAEARSGPLRPASSVDGIGTGSACGVGMASLSFEEEEAAAAAAEEEDAATVVSDGFRSP